VVESIHRLPRTTDIAGDTDEAEKRLSIHLLAAFLLKPFSPRSKSAKQINANAGGRRL
jgi:hypothetical protein